MTTPLSPYIVDCDIHPSASPQNPLEPFIPANFQQAVAQGQAVAPTHGYINPFGVNRRDAPFQCPKDVIEGHFQKNGITYGLLQSPGMSIGLIHNIDVANAMARAWNDWQAEHYLRVDSRFLGSVCVNMNDPAAAAAEIRRSGGHPSVMQVITVDENDKLYGHRSFFPIYEACVEMELAFAIHPGAIGCLRSSTPVGRPSSYFEWHSTIPLNYQAHLASMVCEGVFEKFPALRVMFVEAGVSWLAALMWRLDRNYKALRATTPWLRELPSTYIRRNVRLTSQPIEEPEKPEQLLSILSAIHGDEIVLYASDFPHWDFDDPARALPAGLPVATRHRILYQNAFDLFGLTPPRVATAVPA